MWHLLCPQPHDSRGVSEGPQPGLLLPGALAHPAQHPPSLVTRTLPGPYQSLQWLLCVQQSGQWLPPVRQVQRGEVGAGPRGARPWTSQRPQQLLVTGLGRAGGGQRGPVSGLPLHLPSGRREGPAWTHSPGLAWGRGRPDLGHHRGGACASRAKASRAPDPGLTAGPARGSLGHLGRVGRDSQLPPAHLRGPEPETRMLRTTGGAAHRPRDVPRAGGRDGEATSPPLSLQSHSGLRVSPGLRPAPPQANLPGRGSGALHPGLCPRSMLIFYLFESGAGNGFK